MNIALKVNGRELSGWLSASVTRGIERAAGDFRLSISERWPGSDDPDIKIGDVCQVTVGKEKVLTGYVSTTRIEYDSETKSIIVEGKSRVADIVRCSVLDAKPYNERKIEDIVRELVAPFGISVRADVDTGKPITLKPRQGDTVFGAISDAVNMRGLLAYDDAAGNLVLGRVGALTADQSLVQRGNATNVASGSVVQTDEDRFSLYKVVGQDVGTDFNTAEDSAGPSATIEDPNIRRYLPLVVMAEKAADKAFCRERAIWERARRIGSSIPLQYDVNGWRQISGALWQPNMLVSIDDEIGKISGRFVVSEVTWSYGPAGEITTLSCLPPEAFATEPTVPDTADSSGFWQAIQGAAKNATR
ncbi:phage baseplate assembly protein [Sneathiella sp.]|uniref:phage baseplate assembly protein n=1 Tax=Sneathiella sp. TaxID=1964365 RepID=UPI002FE29931